MRCSEIMNPRVERIQIGEKIRAAAIRMRDHDIGFLPVVDERGMVVGTITDRDITVRSVAEGHPESTVGECMTREVISCFANDDVSRVEELMSLYQKSRIVILDDQGMLAGVISLSDIAQHQADAGAQTLREVTTREAHV